MTEEQIALARRAVACKGWRWMPGMSICAMGLTSLRGLDICDHGRVLDVMNDDGMQMVSASEYPYDEDGVPEYRWADAMHIPDLGDPATLGCLLALVREAHGHKLLHLSYRITKSEAGFACYTPRPRPWVSSEAEALVAALEDAP
jgi:hypothetical protein